MCIFEPQKADFVMFLLHRTNDFSDNGLYYKLVVELPIANYPIAKYPIVRNSITRYPITRGIRPIRGLPTGS